MHAFAHHLQLFQSFVHALLTVFALWKAGNDGSAYCLRQMKYAVSTAVATMELIGHHSGASVYFAKAHDLSHIIDDFKLFGSCGMHSTGESVTAVCLARVSRINHACQVGLSTCIGLERCGPSGQVVEGTTSTVICSGRLSFTSAS